MKMAERAGVSSVGDNDTDNSSTNIDWRTKYWEAWEIVSGLRKEIAALEAALKEAQEGGRYWLQRHNEMEARAAKAERRCHASDGRLAEVCFPCHNEALAKIEDLEARAKALEARLEGRSILDALSSAPAGACILPGQCESLEQECPAHPSRKPAEACLDRCPNDLDHGDFECDCGALGPREGA